MTIIGSPVDSICTGKVGCAASSGRPKARRSERASSSSPNSHSLCAMETVPELPSSFTLTRCTPCMVCCISSRMGVPS